MKTHPIAQLFPLIKDNTREFRDLVGSIQEDGLIDPIVMDGDMLVDGRNRLAACKEAGVQPRFVQWKSLNPKGSLEEWIYSRNINRRHLTADQIASIYTQFNAATIRKLNKEQMRLAPKIAIKKENKTCGYQTVSANNHKNLQSAVGQIAKGAGVSYRKARQALKLRKAVEDGLVEKEVEQKVAHGLVKLKDAVPEVKTIKLSSLPEKIKNAWSAFKAKFTQDELVFAINWVRKEINQ